MAKVKLNGQYELDASEILVKDGVLYIDGKKEMDWPHTSLQVESDGGLASVNADIPLSMTSSGQGASSNIAMGNVSVSGGNAASVSVTQGSGGSGSASGGAAAASAGGSAAAGSGGAAAASGGSVPDGDTIARHVQEKVAEQMKRAFPPGFPFTKK